MLLVSQLLGHSSVSTTMRYIGINTDLMRDAVEATTRADVSECRQREAVTAFMPAKTMQGLTFGGLDILMTLTAVFGMPDMR